MSMIDQHDEYRVFFDRIPEIRLMVRDILLNQVPISEQPDILKKLKILNYALGEWMQQKDTRELHENLSQWRRSI